MSIDTSLSPEQRLRRLRPPDSPVSIVLDTDAYNEIDDQFAIAYAVCSDLDIEAMYAAPFHNDRSMGPGDGMEKSYREIERVLDRLGESPDVVARGATDYLPAADEPVDSPAVADVIERATRRDASEPLYVVAIGAATNVASAILTAPDIVEDIVVVWLGGYPHAWPTAREFNLRQDPHASRVLFDSGVPLVHVPCKNVAEHLRTTVPELRTHLSDGGIAEYLFESFADYADDRRVWSKEIWDVATVAYLLDSDRVSTNVTHSPALTSELTWSRDESRHLIRVATDVDRDAVFSDLFETLN